MTRVCVEQCQIVMMVSCQSLAGPTVRRPDYRLQAQLRFSLSSGPARKRIWNAGLSPRRHWSQRLWSIRLSGGVVMSMNVVVPLWVVLIKINTKLAGCLYSKELRY